MRRNSRQVKFKIKESFVHALLETPILAEHKVKEVADSNHQQMH